MKKLLPCLALVLALIVPAIAKDMKTETIKLPTIQCGMCEETIETKLKDLKGLASIAVDSEEMTATVVYDADVTTLTKIEKAIAKAGYDANETKADRKAQRKLDRCCQPGAHK